MWDDWKFVLGEWQGEGGGEPGQGTGGFTFCPDLNDRILVRRNHADYPAAGQQAAFSHEDLLIVYFGQGQSQLAIYFDNEGHVIHYMAELSPDRQALVLVSEVQTAAPRFRLTYRKAGADALCILFEIAPPGRPDEFSIYTDGVVRRKGSACG